MAVVMPARVVDRQLGLSFEVEMELRGEPLV